MLPAFSPHTSKAKGRDSIMFDIQRLLNAFVMHCSYVITLEELQVNQVLLGSKIMKLKNIFMYVCSLVQ